MSEWANEGRNITIGDIADAVAELALERVLAKLEERGLVSDSEQLQDDDQ